MNGPLCESCRLEPATVLVVAAGRSFRVCPECAAAGVTGGAEVAR